MSNRSFLCRPALRNLLGAALLGCLSAGSAEALERQVSPTASIGVLGRGQMGKPGQMGKSFIYRQGWIDLNKDGVKNIYEDPSQPVEKRVTDLIGRMTLAEKLGQLRFSSSCDEASVCTDGQLQIIEKGGIGCYQELPPVDLRNQLQKASVEHSRLGIPLGFGFEIAKDGIATPVSGGAPLFIQPVSLRLGKASASPDLDQKVRLILWAKFTRGLFDQPYLQSKAENASPGSTGAIPSGAVGVVPGTSVI